MPSERIIYRQIERRPLEALLTLAGLAFAGAIMMIAYLQDGAIDFMVKLQYRMPQQHDVTATFVDVTPRRAIHELRALPGVHLMDSV